jgi:hypothetical protein
LNLVMLAVANGTTSNSFERIDRQIQTFKRYK